MAITQHDVASIIMAILQKLSVSSFLLFMAITQHDVASTLGLALGACGLDAYDPTAMTVEPVANEQWVEQIKV